MLLFEKGDYMFAFDLKSVKMTVPCKPQEFAVVLRNINMVIPPYLLYSHLAFLQHATFLRSSSVPWCATGVLGDSESWCT